MSLQNINIGILLAAGKSKRFGSDKLFFDLNGKPIIFYALQFLNESRYVDEIFIAANSSNKKRIEKLVHDESFRKVKKIVLGGKTRFESVKKAIHAIRRYPQPSTTIRHLVIHNAVNPYATQKELYQCINTLKRMRFSGVGVGRPVVSTIKQINPDRTVHHTLPRTQLWEMETPQVVRAGEFMEVVKKAPQKADYTDDLSVLESAGKKTGVVLASPRNKKITTPDDLPDTAIAVGIGEDSHEFKVDGFLTLGGVKIKNLPALEADSDGDVVLHALCNALASALGKGSLGTYATRMCKNGIRDSRVYLQKIMNELYHSHRSIKNCSIAIEASRPKIDPLANAFKKSLGKLLKIPQERIGITATSGKSLTPFGRGKAIRCQAAVLLE
ncbi:2-C-methyl-D-erythritol 2,4-cyclodiphosphate synthase [Candidatus Peregrinibacteria bacterium]|nr:2-C-methyl-D-erythritol 2,4-cyclodiphosphate synthase [Candidatus Peregrinibacteria bacterium]